MEHALVVEDQEVTRLHPEHVLHALSKDKSRETIVCLRTDRESIIGADEIRGCPVIEGDPSQ